MDENETRLEAAVRTFADEDRRHLGEHPSIEEMTAYRAGELPPAETDRLRDHLALCHGCADLLLDLAAFPHLEPPAGVEPVTDEDVAAAWREMKPELLAAAGAAGEPARRPLAAERGPKESLWETLSRLFASPRFAYGLAAVLLLAVPLTRWWTLNELSRPAVNVPINNLVSERNRGGPQKLVLPSNKGQFLLVLNLVSRRTYDDYVVEISDPEDPEGTPRWRRAGLEPSDVGNFNLLMPRDFLPAGSYTIRLLGRDGGTLKLVVEYSVEVEHESSQESEPD